MTALFLLINLSAFSANRQIGRKDIFMGRFYIGTAMNTGQITGKDSAAIRIIKQHFNTITTENCMKCGSLQPEEGKFNFALADQFVAFGMQNKMFIVGHNLVWHSQTPKWFFIDEKGADVDSRVGYKAELNPYVNGLPEEVEKAHAKRYKEFFDLFVKHQDKISRVTLWGVQDGQSWKNKFPVQGRTDYPLLFDRNYQPKSFVKSLLTGSETSALKSGSNYLVKDIYTADPSAHVFNGKIYIYPSHDIESGIKENDNGDHFDMRDYHIFSMDKIWGTIKMIDGEINTK
jgi:GH35 family endo-1,4-beta-xylanase